MAKIAAELDEKKKKDEEKEAARKQVGSYLRSSIDLRFLKNCTIVIVPLDLVR